jgi:hypothetical protein
MARSCRRHGELGHEIVDGRTVAGVNGDLDRIEPARLPQFSELARAAARVRKHGTIAVQCERSAGQSSRVAASASSAS